MAAQEKKVCYLLYCILISLILSSHLFAQNDSVATYNTTLMGTYVTIQVRASEDQKQKTEEAIERAISRMDSLVNLVSSWDPASETSKINDRAGEGPVSVDKRLIDILLESQKVSEFSGGAFDITFSPIGKLWKLDPANPIMPEKSEIINVLKLVDHKKLFINKKEHTAQLKEKGMRIDLGGIAKGSVVDEGAGSLINDGIVNFLINAGGDLRINSSSPEEPWKIGITNPRDPRGPVIATLKLTKGAIVTSGDYEKMFVIDGKRYHHIINPKTGYPVDHCISVTVIAPDAQTADAFSTAFFVLGPTDGLKLCEKLKDIEALFVDNKFNISSSSGFPEVNMINSIPNIQPK